MSTSYLKILIFDGPSQVERVEGVVGRSVTKGYVRLSILP